MPEKNVAEINLAVVGPLLALLGVVLGWLTTKYKAGFKDGKTAAEVSAFRTDFDEFKDSIKDGFEVVHKRIDKKTENISDLHGRVSKLEGKIE